MICVGHILMCCSWAECLLCDLPSSVNVFFLAHSKEALEITKRQETTEQLKHQEKIRVKIKFNYALS